jgi:hypothetical protein
MSFGVVRKRIALRKHIAHDAIHFAFVFAFEKKNGGMTRQRRSTATKKKI